MVFEDPEDEQIALRLRKLSQTYESDGLGASTSSHSSQMKDVSLEEIQRRMEKLRASNPTITEEELEYRLMKLQDKPRPAVIKIHSIKRKCTDVPSSSSTKSDDVQIKKLIRQYTQELDIETNVSSTDTFIPDNIPEDPAADELIQLVQTELQNEQSSQNGDSTIKESDMLERLKALD